MRIRTRPASAALLPLLLAVAAGCGGGADDASSPTTTAGDRPALAAPAAERLVVHSDAVALKLAAGDECGAAEEADKLRGEFVALVNEGQIPATFQEDLGARVNELVDSVNCPPPAPAPAATQAEEDDDGHDDGKGKAKGRKKRDTGGKHGKGDD